MPDLELQYMHSAGRNRPVLLPPSAWFGNKQRPKKVLPSARRNYNTEPTCPPKTEQSAANRLLGIANEGGIVVAIDTTDRKTGIGM